MRKFIIDSDYTVATSNAIFEVTQPCTITYSPSGNDTGNTIKNVSGGSVTLQTASVAPGEERDTIDGVYEITISSDSNVTIYEVAQGAYESVSGPNSQKMEKFSSSSLGKENGGYSWWCYPLFHRFSDAQGNFDESPLSDYFVYSYVKNTNEIIAVRTDNKGNITSRFSLFKDPTEYDEHNVAAIDVMDDGRLITAYARHNLENKIYYRVSLSVGDVDFGSQKALSTSGTATYAQLIVVDTGRIYLFYRVASQSWAIRYSDDNGSSWSSEQLLFTTSSTLHYMRAVKNDNDVRFLLIGHPTNSTDHDIRYGKITTSSGVISTIGNGNIGNISGTNLPLTNLDFVAYYSPSGGNLTRLFDYAYQSNPSGGCFAFALFASENADAELYVTKSIDGEFRTRKVCDIGGTIDGSSYYCGAWFEYDNEQIIYVGREDSGVYYIDKYSTDATYQVWTFVENIVRDNTHKLYRPMSPNGGGNAILYNKAEFYNHFDDYYAQPQTLNLTT